MATKPQILFGSDEAAKFVHDIKGWVSSDGRFFGTDEQSARYAGCTHSKCECGNIIEKHLTICEPCRIVQLKQYSESFEKYENLTKKEWDGVTPLYSIITGDYFYSASELNMYLNNRVAANPSFKISNLYLVICDPVYPFHPDLYEIYKDTLPEGADLLPEIHDGFDALNKIISQHEIPLSWVPGKFAAGFPSSYFTLPSPSLDAPKSPDIVSKSRDNSVYLLSNHKDIAFLKKFYPDSNISLILHPRLDPAWSENEIRIHCSSVISKAVKAGTLIINGDYFLVSLILKARLESGKSTGFVAFEKLSSPDTTSSDGIISYSNSVKPVRLRWIHASLASVYVWQRLHELFDSISKAKIFASLGQFPNGWEAWAFLSPPIEGDTHPEFKVKASSALAAMELLYTQLKNNSYL